LHQRLQLGDVMNIRGGQQHRQWHPLRITNYVMFAAFFRSIRGIGARFGPPKSARTLAESTTARSHWMRSASRNRDSKTQRIFSHTPAPCHSRSRRQQVMGEPHPNSWGSMDQGIPLRNTNRIPVKAARSGTRGRPPLGLGAFGGNNGSISFHSSSLTSGLVMAFPPLKKCLRFSLYTNSLLRF
jgi:hypothetical protein